jgi:hypothetical protein
MLFRGYSKATKMETGLLRGKTVKMGANDESNRIITAKQQLVRMRGAQEELEKGVPMANVGKTYGVRGVCPIFEALPYVHSNNLFVLPFGHAVYYGVVKDFFNLLLGKEGVVEAITLSPESKILMRRREADFTLPGDFGRPYLSVVDKSGSYVMENWARLVEVFAVYLLSKDVHGRTATVLQPLAKKAWGHLRRFVMYHMRPKATMDQDARLQARAELLEYAKIMDQVRYY